MPGGKLLLPLTDSKFDWTLVELLKIKICPAVVVSSLESARFYDEYVDADLDYSTPGS